MSLIGYLKAYVSAAKAGRIASSCKTGCVIDDETETIRPCFIHLAEITRLAKQNEKDFNS